MKVKSDFRVRYKETDAMGISYYGNYFTWFEVGRSSFFRELGFTYKQLEEEGVISPILEAYAKYHKSTYYDDLLTVETEVTQFTGAKLKFNYEIYRDGELVTSGWTMHCFVSKEGKLVNLKKTNNRMAELLTKDNR
jgi:acyl-CoA thioester hydrolase